ncbi:MAG: preprotein translocase subunit SecG [Candidatus Coatesbacteria bacterium]
MTILYVFVCLLLIVAVLIQQGKGSGMGALTGAGQTWFGPAGSKTLLMKITLGLAGVFLVMAVIMTLAATRRPMAPPPQEAPAAQAPAPASTPAPAPAK